jgi:hypothetical protein
MKALVAAKTAFMAVCTGVIVLSSTPQASANSAVFGSYLTLGSPPTDDSASTRGREAKFGCDTHHDLSLAVID